MIPDNNAAEKKLQYQEDVEKFFTTYRERSILSAMYFWDLPSLL